MTARGIFEENVNLHPPISSHHLLLLLLALLRHTGQPVDEQGTEDVEDNVDPHNAKVPPRILPVDVDRRNERVGRAHRAELAVRARVGLEKVAACRLRVVRQVLLASLPITRLEAEVLVRCTFDSGIGDTRGQHARHEVSERRHVVHEDPETGERVLGGKYTAMG